MIIIKSNFKKIIQVAALLTVFWGVKAAEKTLDANLPVDYTDDYLNATEENMPIAIYHAFDETFDDINKKVDALAAAGFSHIQVSPVQESDWETMANRKEWWNAYRPISYQLSQTGYETIDDLNSKSGNKYGNKEQFEALIKAAAARNIKIIVDVVFNHLGPIYPNEAQWKKLGIDPEGEKAYLTYNHWKSAWGNRTEEAFLNLVFDKYKGLFETEYKNHSEKIKEQRGDISYEEYFTKYILRGCRDWGFGEGGKHFPSVNFKNKVVRGTHMAFLEALLKMGVGGFRFDAVQRFADVGRLGIFQNAWWALNSDLKAAWHKIKSQTEGSTETIFSYGELASGNSEEYKQYLGTAKKYTGPEKMGNEDLHMLDFIMYRSLGSIFGLDPDAKNRRTGIREPINLTLDPWAVTFTDNHDTWAHRKNSERGLPGWGEDIAYNPVRVLTTVYLLARRGGVPLILNKMYEKKDKNKEGEGKNKKIINRALEFRKKMREAKAKIEKVGVLDHAQCVIAIKRENEEKKYGLVIINNSMKHYVIDQNIYNDLMKNTGEELDKIVDVLEQRVTTTITIEPWDAAFFYSEETNNEASKKIENTSAEQLEH